MAETPIKRQTRFGFNLHISCGSAVDFRLPTSDFRLQTSDFRLPPSHFEYAHDGGGDPSPLALLASELFAALPRQRVEARLPVVVRRAPLAIDEAAPNKALQPRAGRSV